MATRLKRIAWTALAVTMMASSIHAQESTVRSVDPEQSKARIFLSSSSKPQLERNVSVARVSGRVENKPGSSPTAFDFTIYPADQRDDNIGSDATVISFHSKRVEHVDGGHYRATGELTVTYVERTATYGPEESYSGPVYGPTKTYSVNREASFDFQPVRNADGGAGYGEWIATSTVTARAFPELLQAVASRTWPAYVNNDNCSIPGNVGEDYSGPTCTGELVATTARTDLNCTTPTTTGEGYSGQVCDGSLLRVPTTAELDGISAKNGDVKDSSADSVADEVRLVLDLRMGESHVSLAGNAGK